MNYIVEQTESFAKWRSALRGLRAKVAIARRLERAQNGNLGGRQRFVCTVARRWR